MLVACSPFAHTQEVQRLNFADWLADFKQEAIAKGIRPETVDSAFAGMTEPLEKVITLDGKQPEHTILFSEYVKNIVSEKRVKLAKAKLEENRATLQQIEQVYQVDASIIVALWSIESNFGKNQGNYSVVQSLASLAYEGRRSEFFKKELVNALKIMEQENIPPEELTGSWAGAMGQTQFMPSSFLSYAVDFDGNGKKDIWHSDADALASIANYLHQKHWKLHEGWGIKVKLPDDNSEKWQGYGKQKQPLMTWSQLGIRQINGKKIPQKALQARLVIPEDDTPSAFLVFPNYEIIMDWNRSTYFATSVGLLADAIRK